MNQPKIFPNFGYEQDVQYATVPWMAISGDYLSFADNVLLLWIIIKLTAYAFPDIALTVLI